MRDYAQLQPRFWTHGTGKALRGDHQARELAVYLVSAPTSNMIGLYYLPISTIAHELGLTIDGASEALRRVCEAGFAHYDHESEYVYVPNMARIQVAPRLKSKDKRVFGVLRELEKHPNCPFRRAFVEKYAEPYGLWAHLPHDAYAEPPRSPSDAPPKPGTGTGTGTGSIPPLSPPAVPKAPSRPHAAGLTPERMQVIFRGAHLEAFGHDPSMGGRNLGDFPERVLRTARRRERDPEELFREVLERWIESVRAESRKDQREVNARSPYACFAQAFGKLVDNGHASRTGMAPPAPAEAFTPDDLDEVFPSEEAAS